jgi:hypothetical protein
MDPLTLVATIVGIIAGVTTVGQHAYHLYDQLSHSLEEVRLFREEIRHFGLVWAMVERILTTENIPDEPHNMIGWYREETTHTLDRMRRQLENFERSEKRAKKRWVMRNGPLAILRGPESALRASGKRWKAFLATRTMRLDRESLQLARQTLIVILNVIQLVICWLRECATDTPKPLSYRTKHPKTRGDSKSRGRFYT